MGKYFRWKVLLIIAVTAFCIWRAYPPSEKINLGLDLQGGIQLLLQIETDKVPAELRADATERVVEVVRNRIDEFGVREPVITKQGKDQVVVQLPGITDRERAREIVGKTAHLEFRLVNNDPDLLQKSTNGTAPEGFELKEYASKAGAGGGPVLLEKNAMLTGDHLTNASVGFDQYGQAIVQLQFDKEGARLFDQITFRNIGKQLAIVLDGKIHSAPVIRDRIPNGTAQISGNFTSQEASDLALVLRAGALPAPVHIVEERTVGATLGRDSIQNSLKAGMLGTLLVFIFMPFYYRLSGFVADIGLLIYMAIVIGFLAAFRATLTLPGIAGGVLSIGMAVDANVLLNERMREEMAAGRTARATISAGYHRALSAIIDTHATTLLTSAILFAFGTGPIKGFAVTLCIGIVGSIFSEVFVTRVIFDYITSKNADLKLKMLHFFPKTHINFLKGRLFAYGFSVLTIIVGVSAFAMKGNANFGVEFTGGTMVRLGFDKSTQISDVRHLFDQAGIREVVIQGYGEAGQNQFLAKTQKGELKKIEELTTKDPSIKILSVDDVGSTVSKDLKSKALWAVFWSSLGILLYLAWRYEFKFAAVAVIALLHDTLFTFGVFSLSGREINLPIIAAILTIMGYSVNDTIITFDRVRENLKTMRKVPFSEIVNASINQTLSRTILSSFTTLITTLALFVFGGSAVNDFAFTLLIGFTVGIYSTVFVASALIVDWHGKAKEVKVTKK